MRAAVLVSLGILGCGSTSASTDAGATADATASGNVGFRVDGVVVDKVSCPGVDSTGNGCDPVSTMSGGTLVVTLNAITNGGSSASAGTNFRIRAFDGPKQYVVDGTKDAGNFEYDSGQSDMYGELKYWIRQGDTASCTFDITSGPANPTKGSVIDGTFHCENLRADKWDPSLHNFVEQRVNISDGSLHLVLD